MPKNAIREYSTTESDNTEIAGIGILGTSAVSNFDGALRTLMKQMADMNAGTSPINDTFTLCDPADATKRVRIDASNVAAGQTRVLSMPNANVSISAFAATYLDETTAGAMRSVIGAQVQDAGLDAIIAVTPAPASKVKVIGVNSAGAITTLTADTGVGASLLAAPTSLSAQQALSLVPGTDVLPFDATTTFTRTLLDDGNASGVRNTLGLGSSATVDTGTSGAKVPLLTGANTWSDAQFWSSGIQRFLQPSGGAAFNRRNLDLESAAPAINFIDTTAASTDALVSVDSGNFRIFSHSAGDGTDLVQRFEIDLSTGAITATSGAIVWTSSNDGAGSGLDADLLDGNSSSFYQQALSPLIPGPTPAGRMRVLGKYDSSSALGFIDLDKGSGAFISFTSL